MLVLIMQAKRAELAIDRICRMIISKKTAIVFACPHKLGGFAQVAGKVAKQHNSTDEAQLLNELKATGIKVGLLINFEKDKVEFKRLVF